MTTACIVATQDETMVKRISLRKTFLLLLIHGLAFASPSTDVAQMMQQIPETDRFDLERFFQILIQQDLMGYTLFGEKPMSGVTVLNLKVAHGFPATKYLILEKGWQAWLRNRHLISEQHFCLRRKSTGKIVSIHLVNKKKALEVIENNWEAFQSLDIADPKEILTKICDQHAYREALKSYSLLGVFYGYGKKNGQTFEREALLFEALSCEAAPPFSWERIGANLSSDVGTLLSFSAGKRRFGKPRSHPLARDEIRELNQLISSRKVFELNEESPFLTQFASPNFVFWDEEETRQLKDSYSATRSRMREVYSTGSFLEKTLQQWIFPE